MGHDILAAITAFALCMAWFAVGDVLFPEITLGKVVFTLMPAVAALAFWKLEKNQ